MWKLLTVALLTTGQAPEITDPQPTYGHLGAKRPAAAGVLPGDIAYFNFQVKNLKLDENGRASYSVAIEVHDEHGKLVFEQKPFNAVAQNVFGGNLLPVSAHLAVPPDAPPGKLQWKVTVKDRSTQQSAELRGEGKVLPKAFGVVRVGTFSDPEATSPVPPVGVVGSTLYLDFSLIGFGRDAKSQKPDVNVAVKIVDEKGQPTLPKGLSAHVHDEVAPDAKLVPLQYALTLNRPGQFTIEISARCGVSGGDSQVRLPVRILARD